MLLKNKLEDIKSFLDSDNVLASLEERYCYAKDASNLNLDYKVPDLVVFVESIDDVQKTMKYAYEHSIPVIASGDVVDKESFDRVLSETGCDAVMIGRGALGNPEIFSEITGKPVTMNKVEIIEKHIAILRENFSENFISGHIRKHLLWYLKGEKNVSELKVYVSTEPDLDKCVEAIRKHFENK